MVKIKSEHTNLFSRNGMTYKDLTNYNRENSGFKVNPTWEDELITIYAGEREYPDEVLESKSVQKAIERGIITVAMNKDVVKKLYKDEIIKEEKKEVKDVKETKESPLETAAKDE